MPLARFSGATAARRSIGAFLVLWILDRLSDWLAIQIERDSRRRD